MRGEIMRREQRRGGGEGHNHLRLQVGAQLDAAALGERDGVLEQMREDLVEAVAEGGGA